MAPNSLALSIDACVDLEAALRRLGPSVRRVLAETAGAFLAADASPGSDWRTLSRLPDLGVLHCSQRNVGEKLEMICNLEVESSEWRRLLGEAACEDLCQDAFCEMANCICGSLLADAGFLDAFGYLVPCVPFAGPFRVAGDARTLRGAFRLGGALVHYAITVQAAAGALRRQPMLAA